MTGSTAARVAAQRRAGKTADADAGKAREYGTTAGRVMTAREAENPADDTDHVAEPVTGRRRRRVGTAERYARLIREQHPGTGFNDPGAPPKTGRTAGEQHVARLRGEGGGGTGE